MVNRAKNKGTATETAIVNQLREWGYNAERSALAGALDEGDVVIRESNGHYTIIEAKDRSPMNITGAVREALKERDQFAKARSLDPKKIDAFAVVKQRGKNISQAFVITTMEEAFK